MSDISELYVICEGQTEQTFVRNLLAPHLAGHGVYCHASLLGTVGRKGGDVQFHRMQRDVEMFLKQRPHTTITTMFDYYGIAPDWPGKSSAPTRLTPHQIAHHCEIATMTQLVGALPPSLRVSERFIPYLMMHEFEALLFSHPAILAAKLGVMQAEIDAILLECGEPEAINDSPQTAPSKRLGKLTNYRKIVTGIAVAQQIGLHKIREQCPHFSHWLGRIEQL